MEYRIITYFNAAVWFVNGFFCKVLGLVPRHEQIVHTILNSSYSPLLTVLIGVAEIIMAVWIVSKYMPRFNAIVQIAVVMVMNILEFVLCPDLLLWGRFNALFALGFAGLIYYNEFVLRTKLRMA